MSTPVTSLRAVVLDWAGTVVDWGSRAPMGVFVEVFDRFGVEVSISEARQPMGLPKIAHIRALGAQPRIAAAWQARHGRAFTEADAQAVHDVFVPLNAEVVSDYAQLIPGAVELAAELRRRGLRLGSTTGYTREIMARLLPLASAQGYAPDNLVCAGDLVDGRPTPLMMYRCFADLGVFPPEAVLVPLERPRQLAALVPGIGHHGADQGEQGLQAAEQAPARALVGDAGRLDAACNDQPQRIHQDGALPALDPLCDR